MKTKKIGIKTKITFSYLEWVAAGKKLPQHELIDGKVEYVINEVPEDKEEFFENLGWKVVLVVSKGKGRRKW